MFTALFSIVTITLALSCILTPGVYSLLELSFGENLWPYSRVFDRVAMLAAVLVLWLYRSKFSLAPLKKFYTRTKLKHEYPLAILATFIATSCTLVFIPYYVAQGELLWTSHNLVYWLERIPKVLIGALLISIIEESFFRGLVFQNLKSRSTTMIAAFISSAFYASVHFIRPIYSWEYPGFSLLIGFEYLGEVFKAMFTLDILASFIGLFVVGLVLCRILEKSGSLILCIGLHIGWVIAIKLTVYLTESVPGYVYEGGRRYFLVGKPLVWSTVILVFIVVSLTIANKLQAKNQT
ncbi:MAG: CPBP family intramembrane glutamic endopeptidase [Bdellovibrionota bacterium]